MTDTNKTKETIDDLLRKAHGDKIDDKPSIPPGRITEVIAQLRDGDGLMEALGLTKEQVNEKFEADVKLMYELEAKLAEAQAPYEFAVRGMALTEIMADNIINTVAARGERTKELTDNDRATLASAVFASLCAKLNPGFPTSDQDILWASAKISYAVALHHPLVQYIAASTFMQSAKEKLLELGMGVESFTLRPDGNPELKMTAKEPGK